jgi:hypothetical protein
MTVVHYVDDVCALGHAPKSIVGIWRGGLVPARVDAMVELGKRAKAANGGERVGSLSVVIQLPDMKKGVDPMTRELTKELTGKMNDYSFCGAQVFEGSGLWVSAVRMLVTATIIAGKTDVPSKVFDNVAAATAWLQSQGSGEPQDMLDAERELRALLIARPLPT